MTIPTYINLDELDTIVYFTKMETETVIKDFLVYCLLAGHTPSVEAWDEYKEETYSYF